MKIGIIGAGAWGTALAIHFARKQHEVTLFTETENDAQRIRDQQENKRFLATFRLPENLKIQVVSKEIAYSELILAVVPTGALRAVLRDWIYPYAAEIPILAACKGFEQQTGLLPHQILHECLPQNAAVGLLSGPSFAQEVAQGLPCAVCLASENFAWIEQLAIQLNSPSLRFYSNNDPIGVAVGGATKNVLAIATGVADGLHCGLNARAALITRGLAEITRLALALDGNANTLVGLAGIGDLILTCTGDLSRNRQVGLALAQGKTLNDILAELGHVAEGVYTVSEVVRLAKQLNIEMPISSTLLELIQGQCTASQAVEKLMGRTPKVENT
ncbi:MAG: NAD(P)-dependent glycerol-3-phosphate dehydrogenase [Neisseriaceae bacterium]|nr:NAD(P)-dependent glycerol-3-phosphate dehydrogenase [Neisseriaceae bacterium]